MTEFDGLWQQMAHVGGSIPSVSAQLDEHLGDIVKMLEWTRDKIVKLGGTCTLVDNPDNTDARPLPPILTASFVTDPKKKTVCVYGHLDVQPAAKEDGWNTDPFVLTEKDGKLYGRGSTDDKGPALSWLWIIEAHQALGLELPVNIKILYEGMEEFGSEGIFELIQREAKPGKFLDDVDFFCISDNVCCACDFTAENLDSLSATVLDRQIETLYHLWLARSGILFVVSPVW